MMTPRLSLNILLASAAWLRTPDGNAKAPYVPLHKKSVKEILAEYTFVADLTTQEDTRALKTDEIFWKYPFKIGSYSVSPTPDILTKAEDIPQTKGEGRPIEHLNRGRAAFIKGLEGDAKEFEIARQTWLKGRQLYGDNYPFHRRNDFFIANALLKRGFLALKYNGTDWQKSEVKVNLMNAATFLSWAFIVKVDQKDEYVEKMTPDGLLNLAKIYWKYQRYGASFGAATKGLEYLRKTGRKEHRSEFHRIIAEAHIKNSKSLEELRSEIQSKKEDPKAKPDDKNPKPEAKDQTTAAAESAPKTDAKDPKKEANAGEANPELDKFLQPDPNLKSDSYLEAMQEFDILIRQDPDNLEAVASAFARVGDLYYDLNNYELAEDAYALSHRIGESNRQFDPKRLLLRAEAQFWASDFSGAQKSIFTALEGDLHFEDTGEGLTADDRIWANLRMADIYLAQHKFDEAKLAYFKVSSQYGSSLPGRIAKLREACLELPIYEKNNVSHARETLEKYKSVTDLPVIVQEIAWTCQVQSYTDRERTEDMLERVKKFAERYPDAKILQSFVTPVREVQATKIEPYIKSNDRLKMVSFFEKNRKNLFPKVPEHLKILLFETYADIEDAKKASEFFNDYTSSPDSDLKILRLAAVSSELSKDKKWAKISEKYMKIIQKRTWSIEPDALVLRYYQRLRFAKPSEHDLSTLHTLALHFARENPTNYCDLEYPLLSKMSQSSRYDKIVKKRVNVLISATMPTLFKSDESCALSLLELEARYILKDTDSLANAYLSRSSWPLVGGYLHLYWIVAEQVNARGNSLKAKMMWDVLKEKAPEGSPEREFAAARLDPGRTENEKLWQ